MAQSYPPIWNSRMNIHLLQKAQWWRAMCTAIQSPDFRNGCNVPFLHREPYIPGKVFFPWRRGVFLNVGCFSTPSRWDIATFAQRFRTFGRTLLLLLLPGDTWRSSSSISNLINFGEDVDRSLRCYFCDALCKVYDNWGRCISEWVCLDTLWRSELWCSVKHTLLCITLC